MSLRSPTENEITLTPGSSPGQALALSPFDDAQGRRWNGRRNFFRTKEHQTHFFFLSSPACGRGEGEGPAEYDISKECSMMLRSPTENENADYVMPAWIAGIQARKDAPETSVSAWIPALHAGMTQLSGLCLKMSETHLATFSKENTKGTRGPDIFNHKLRGLRALRGDSWTRFLAWLSLSVLLSACASVRGPGDLNAGRHALMNGNYQAAVSDFEAAEQLDPTYIYGGELREGVLSYLGQAQYLTGNYAQARQTLQKALSQHKSDSVGRLYFGLTLHHFGEEKAALQNIKAGIQGIFNFLKYVNSSYALDYGQGWDPGGIIVTRIETALAMIDSGNIDWPKLISDGKFIAIAIEVEDNRFLQEETRFPGFQ